MIKLGRVIPALIFLAVVGAVCFSYYQRSLSFRDAGDQRKRLLPENIADATEGFSFLQSEQGLAKFEIRAEVNLGFKDKKNLLESVTVKLFGKGGNRFDTITSDYCEYDQQKEEIVFSGNVEITLSQPASPQSPGHKVDRVSNDKVTTIHVDEITYLKAAGKAQTEDYVEFVRENVHGTSHGLTYDVNEQSIRLHSDVEIVVLPQDPHEPETHLRCDTLDYYKSSQTIEMRSNVSLLKGDTSMEASFVKAWLRETDQSVSRIDALGKVRTSSRDPRVLLQVDAQEVSYFFDSTGRWLDKVLAKEEVKTISLDPLVKRDLSAREIEVVLRPQTNLVETLYAKGDVVLIFAESPATPPVAPESPSGHSDPRLEKTCQQGDRRLRAPEMRVTFREDGRQLHLAKTIGRSTLEEFPRTPKNDKRVLSAATFQLSFGQDSQIERLTADEAVQVDIIPLEGAVKTSTSDHLDALVDPQTRQISRLHQFGNFRYREGDRQAFAREATYFAEDERTVLEGKPLVKDSQARTTADIIEFEQAHNLTKARGNVRSVFENRGKQPEAGMFTGDAPVYASAEFLEVQTKAGIATYRQRAKLWQEDQVLRADTIVLYRNDKRLAAEKNVTSLFYTEEESGQNRKQERKPTTVRSEELVYDDNTQKATYSKQVVMNSTMGTLRSNQLEVFLTSQAKQANKRAVERLLATGSVKISQPGKLATSESAEFFQAEKKAILTGGMPRVLDSERGSTSGARLTLFLDDGSISIVGSPETRSITRQRVAR
jgi:lipopolysaccharide export system protein LptA